MMADRDNSDDEDTMLAGGAGVVETGTVPDRRYEAAEAERARVNWRLLWPWGTS